MTTHPHAHASGHGPHDAPHDAPHDDAGLADMLDLDAEVVGHLGDITAWIRSFAGCAPRRVLDLGAGSGTGTFALARRFPQAQVVAVDSSAAMLARLRGSALALDLAGRVRTVQADLDERWPDVGAVDLAWAASSLHHLQHPDRVLADLRASLAPGGLVVVVEMDGLPRVLPHDLGVGRPGLEDRCHEATTQQGWNAHPDWGPHLQRAGLELLEQRDLAYVLDPAPAGASRYARLVLGRVRAGLADRLGADDLATLDHLLDDSSPGSLALRRDLVVRSTRTVWVARLA